MAKAILVESIAAAESNAGDMITIIYQVLPRAEALQSYQVEASIVVESTAVEEHSAGDIMDMDK